MKDLLGNRFPRLRESIDDFRDARAHSRGKSPDIINAVEGVVDNIDGKIRLAPGYQKKLHHVIYPSLEYVDELVNRIPPAIEVSSRTFSINPYVNAFFTNISDLQLIFSHSSEIQDYMEALHEDDASCCALLCMHRTEKTVLGMELSGDMLNKDVRQVAVSFTDHRVYSPAPSEGDTREGLKHCMFQGLVNNALEAVMNLRLASHRLQDRHRILDSRLRHYQQRTREIEPGSESATSLAQEMKEADLELRSIEKEMMNTPVHLTPQVLLDRVTEVFTKPDSFVTVREIKLRLNKMGVKLSDDSSEPCNNLDLTEVEIGNDPPRVVSLASFPREELQPRKMFTLPG
jgi:hypothetical protein